MANNSTQRYLDVEKSNGFLSGLLKEEDKPKIAPLSKTVEVDIDVDIEKQIAQLQEARINGTLESKKDLSVDPDKQLKEWQLENEFSSFLEFHRFPNTLEQRNGSLQRGSRSRPEQR